MTAPVVGRRAPKPRNSGLARAFERIVLPFLAVAVTVLNISEAHRRGDLAVDFRTVTPEIRGLIRGVNPFVIDNVGEGGHFLWTVLAGWLLSPFAWLPHGYLVVVALEIFGIVGALLLLGVRDWRLFLIVLI